MSDAAPPPAPVISGRTAERLLNAEGCVTVSLDLGLTQSNVEVGGEEMILPGGRAVRKDALAGAFKDAEDCIELSAGGPRKVYLFSEETGKYYKLYQPFEDRAPTIIIAGATMHTIVSTDPWQDEEEKVRTIPARGGECLDTCFGLGYSAQLLAARGFERVVSCEADANVLSVAAVNPWSRGALEDDRIEVLSVDVREHVRAREDGRFAAVFHDPPTVQQAGELYSGALYAEFARVLARRGSLYHYVGAPGAKLGRDYAEGVIRRLREAGFERTRRIARGVLAVKAS